MTRDEKILEFVSDYAPRGDRIGRYVFLDRLRDLLADFGLPDSASAGDRSFGQVSPAGETPQAEKEEVQ